MTETANPPHIGRPNLDAWLIFIGRGSRDAARTIMAVLIGIYLVEGLGRSNAELGWLLGISLIGGLALSFGVMLSGARLSRRSWFVSLTAITAVAGLLLIFTDNIYLLALGAFFGSYAASGMHVGPIIQLEQSGLAQVTKADRRTRAFSNLTISSAIGRAAGGGLVAIATFLISVRGFELVDAYRVTFGVYIGLTLLTLAIYATLSSAVESPGAAQKSWPNPIKAKERSKILRISTLFGVDSFAGGLIFDTFLALWLFDRFGVNEGTVGGVLIATQMVNLVSLWLAPYVAARFGLLNTFVWTQVVSNLSLIAFAFAPTAPIAIAIWIARGLFDEMDVPTRQAYVMAIVPEDERDMMAGANNLGRGIGRVPSSAVTGLLWAGSVTIAPWLVAPGLKLAYNAAVYRAFRNVDPDKKNG